MVMSVWCIKHHTVLVFICALSFLVFLFCKYILILSFCWFPFFHFWFNLLKMNYRAQYLWANTFIHVLNMSCIIWAGYVAFSLPLGGPIKLNLFNSGINDRKDAKDSLQFSLVHSAQLHNLVVEYNIPPFNIEMIALFQLFPSTDRPTE